jgi:hypothetical protein
MGVGCGVEKIVLELIDADATELLLSTGTTGSVAEHSLK